MKRLLLLLLVTLCGCVPSSDVTTEKNSSGPAILVTVPPIADLVRRVTGDSVAVTVLVPAGKEPETFAPTPADVMKIANCSFFFRVGLAVEAPLLKRLQTVNPKMKIVDLRKNLPFFHLHEDDHGVHEGDDHHDCGEDGIDPHIWMSPGNLIPMAETISQTLSLEFPSQTVTYQTNLEKFRNDILTLQTEITERLAPLRCRTLYVFHPAYGYYCQEFHLEQKAIEAGGKSPKSKDLVDLIRTIQDEKADKIFVQPEFSQTAVKKIAEAVSISIAVHSPLGEDCLENIRNLTDLIVTP